MAPATQVPQQRLRQIAIVLSSVDAATARQLLLQLPTDIARQVRALAGQIGNVSAEEKRTILQAFARSQAVSQGAAQAAKTSAEQTANAQRPANSPSVPRPSTSVTSDMAMEQRGVQQVSAAENGAATGSDQGAGPSWARLSPDALAGFLRQEREMVIAVVITQLPPRHAVQVLERFPSAMVARVLQQMSVMQDVDDDVLSAVNDYLAESLGDYQRQIETESQSRRRLDGLLQYAPEHLRGEWSQLIQQHAPGVVIAPASATSGSLPSSTAPPMPEFLGAAASSEPSESSQRTERQATVDRFYEGAAATPAELIARQQSDQLDLSADKEMHEPTILPFEKPSDEARISEPVAPAAFEEILEYPTETLAAILSREDAEVVLLALAGASSRFMKRFLHMLEPSDARKLEKRLKAIGPITLRDVDAAQRKLLETADRITNAQSKPVRPRSVAA